MCRRLLAVTAYAGVVGIWVVLTASAIANPGVIAGIAALSDLGGPRAQNPLVFNCGVIVVAAVLAAYSAGLMSCCKPLLCRAGSGAGALSAVSLVFVGVFPEHNPLHTPVAVLFFALAGLAMFLWGLGAVRAGYRREGLAVLSGVLISMVSTATVL